MSELNILISSTGEIISTRMARHIIQLDLGGCTEECIPCHFREIWQRELDQESVSAFLERDIETTDSQVPHGETLLADGVAIVPNGIVSEIVRLAQISDSGFIAAYLNLRYPALQWNFTHHQVERVLMEIDDLWTTGPDGNPILVIRCHEPSGHRIGSLPTTPVTPRNGGRPRTSHRTPPPTYSPCRSEGHPRQVHAPIALLERQALPPPYMAPIALIERQVSPPPYTGQDLTLSAEEFISRRNDAIFSANEFLANVDYVLQPLNAHDPPAPVRHNPWRARPGPFDRPGRPTPLRMPSQATQHSRHSEIAPLDQPLIPSQPTLRPALISPVLRQRPSEHRRRPPPIITSSNNIPLDHGGVPFQIFQGTEETVLQIGPHSLDEDSHLEQGQPVLYLRPSPFSEVGFPSLSPSNIPARPTPMEPETLVLLPRDSDTGSDSDGEGDGDDDEHSISDSLSPFLLNPDLGNMIAERSPDHFANYRARQREARQRERGETSETSEDPFPDPNYDMCDA